MSDAPAIGHYRCRNQTQEESIYNLIPTIPPAKEKPARYKSKFAEAVRHDLKNNKTNSKTMGPAKVEVAKPKEFLVKHSKEKNLSQGKSQFKYPDADKRKPSVPKHNEKPAIMGVKSNKNFITTNAVENIMSIPKKHEKKYADTKIGATHQLEPSGLTPKYRNKKDFGKTPEYLEKRKKEVEQAQIEYDTYIREKFRLGAMKKLSEDERQAIINGLKSNWEELHHHYQGLSVVTDTAPKKARKENLEAQMKQLERDIDTMEKHKIIYIAS